MPRGRPPAIEIKPGSQFGRLTVTKLANKTKRGLIWRCKCSCGNKAKVKAENLRNGDTQSCGCLRIETGKNNRLKHGATNNGMETPEYNSWRAMRERCNNPNNIGYINYGGRGIKVCSRWNNIETGFANFLADMGPRSKNQTLHRKKDAKIYNKKNCVWASYRRQANNKRDNRIVNYNGKSMTLARACRKADLSISTVMSRIINNWPKSKWFIPKLITWDRHTKGNY
jgi:hypothetical protein